MVATRSFVSKACAGAVQVAAREHATARIWGVDPNLTPARPAATVMSPIALSYGSAAGDSELLAWLPIAAGVAGHAAFHGELLGITPGQ
jgi:hypothetical protein